MSRGVSHPFRPTWGAKSNRDVGNMVAAPTDVTMIA
jgi:hypothetical protein